MSTTHLTVTAAEAPRLLQVMKDIQESVAAYYVETARGGDLGTHVRTWLTRVQNLNDLLTEQLGDHATYKALFATPVSEGWNGEKDLPAVRAQTAGHRKIGRLRWPPAPPPGRTPEKFRSTDRSFIDANLRCVDGSAAGAAYCSSTSEWEPRHKTVRKIYRTGVSLVGTATGISDGARCFGSMDGSGCAWAGAAMIPGSGVVRLVGRGLRRLGGAANAGRTAARTCMRSFAGTTPVLMADGTKRPIEEIKVGDKVVATDPETGERVVRKVTKVWVHDDQVLDLVVGGEVITTTEDHLFWSVTDQRFERADEFAAGEVVLGDGGRRLTVSGLRPGTERTALAYNLSIEGVHTYHVGPTAILVHNECPYTPNFKDPSKPPGEGWVWRGPNDKGSWFKPDTRESLHPDLNHPDPIGPHYDWRDPAGKFWRVFPDGRVEPK